MELISGTLRSEIEIIDVYKACTTVILRFSDHLNAEKFVETLSKRGTLPPETAVEILQAHRTLLEDFKLKNATLAGDNPKPSSDPKGHLLIFVHGWRGSGDSFGDLPYFLKQLSGCETAVFEYDSEVLGHSSPPTLISGRLENLLRNKLFEGYSSLGVIAHSLGGIITRDTIGSQHFLPRPFTEKVKFLCFIASPLSGAWLAKLAKYVPAESARQISLASPNDEQLLRITRSWNNFSNQNPVLRKNCRSIFAERDAVVDYASAIGGDSQAIPMLGTDHSSIVRPTSPDQEIVTTLFRLLSEAGLGSRASF